MMKTLDEETTRVVGEIAHYRALTLERGRLVGSTATPDIRVYDGVLDDPLRYRAHLLSLPFRDVPVGAITFHGIAVPERSDFADWLAIVQPARHTTLTFARQSPAGTEEPNYLHTDRDMGQWTAILYLTQPEVAGDGTTFWQHRATGITESTAEADADKIAEWMAWRDLAQWEPLQHAEARFNRAVVFPAGCFHSRAIHENFGTGDASRLIQVAFGVEKE